MIAVIDYGMGNLRSVQKALEIVGAKTVVTSDPERIAKCSKLVFPGVGAFGEAMKELKRLNLVEAMKAAIGKGAPFLGLCLGLQLLFEKSEEDPGVKGLAILKGESKRFRSRVLKIPHMGWNSIRCSGKSARRSAILKGVPDGSYMYFVHSYYARPKDRSVVLTTTDYGGEFVSGVRKDNVYAFQFHPEKSQSIGLNIIRNFVRL